VKRIERLLKKGTIKGEKRKQDGWPKARERNVIRKLTALLSRHNARINNSLTVVESLNIYISKYAPYLHIEVGSST
jgi:hypothetical protein